MITPDKNLVWADATRIVAILLVIVLHTFSVSAEPVGGHIINLFIRVVAKIGVPLFVMLSGALLLNKHESWREFYLRRLKRVLLPWFFWAGTILILNQGWDLTNPFFAFSEFKRILTAEFTFLPLLFCLYLLIPPFQLIIRYGKRPYVMYLLSLWFLAVSLFPYLRNSLAFPLAVDNGLVTQTIKFSGYLLAGWWLSTPKRYERKMVMLMGLVAVGAWSWSTWLVMLSRDINSPMSAYTSPWIIISSMIIFTLLAHLASRFSQLNQSHKKLLQALSRGSFGVFLIHVFVKDRLLNILDGIHSNLIQEIGLWFAVTAISYTIILGLSKIKALQNLVT